MMIGVPLCMKDPPIGFLQQPAVNDRRLLKERDT